MQIYVLIFLLWIGALADGVRAQTNVSAALTRSNRATIYLLPPLPPPPQPLASVDSFLKLMAMPPAEQAEALAQRPPEKRAILESKLREYRALTETQREERLRALRLRALLRHLIRLPSSNRVDYLVKLQTPDRQVMEARLRDWDQMPADLQNEVLENEWAVRVLVRLPQPPAPPGAPSALVSADWEKRMEQWRVMPESQRRRVLAHFEIFCDDLNAEEKARALRPLPLEAREWIQLTLKELLELPRAQRELGLTNLFKLALLTPEERQQFLVNTDLWRQMSPKEQEAWRKLAARLSVRPPMPPMPPRTSSPARREEVK